MIPGRRSVLAALGVGLPFGLPLPKAHATVSIRYVPFEEGLRLALSRDPSADDYTIETAHSDETKGNPGCVNQIAIAGIPPFHLMIVRTGVSPGPVISGIRLYVATITVMKLTKPEPALPRYDFHRFLPAPKLGWNDH